MKFIIAHNGTNFKMVDTLEEALAAKVVKCRELVALFNSGAMSLSFLPDEDLTFGECEKYPDSNQQVCLFFAKQITIELRGTNYFTVKQITAEG